MTPSRRGRLAGVGLLAARLVATAVLAQDPAPEQEAPPAQPPPASAGTEPAAESTPAVPAPEPDSDRIRFELPLSAERGGGTVTGTTGELSYEGDLAVLSGGVELKYQDITIHAQRLQLDTATNDLVASGGITLDQGPERLTGSGIEYNLDTKLGTLHDVVGQMGSDYYFQGALVEKTGDDTYRLEDGTFTACTPDDPPWSFRFKRAKVRVDGFAKARSVTFRAHKVPLLYLPYVVWPVREARTSGLLVPKPGYSSRRGFSLGLAYFQTLGRSYDTTFEVDIYEGGAPQGSIGSGSYLGFGNEVRWQPSEQSAGRFEGYMIRDPERDELRWRINIDHESRDLPWGFRGVVSVEEASDLDFFRDFERRSDQNSIRQLYSRGFLSKNWAANSVNVLFDNRETFVRQDATVTLRQLPEIEYRLRSTRLGKLPLYAQIRSSLHYLDVDRSERQNQSYARADLFPELTLPIRSRPWMSFSLTAGGRYTWWGDSLATRQEQIAQPAESDFRGESLIRFSPSASAEIVGPSFSKIFDGSGKTFAKYKHIIEPRFTYQFIDDFDEEDRIPLFDEIDRIPGANVGRVSLVNRLLAKPADEKRGGAREILSLEIFRLYSFDDGKPLQSSSDRTMVRQAGPLSAEFRYNPSLSTNLRVEADYNTLFQEIEQTSFSGTFAINRENRVGVRWTTRTQAETGQTRANQVRLSTQFGLVPKKLSLISSINYDVERALWQFQRHILSFRGSCYSLSFEAGDVINGDRRDREFRFLLTLKNIGTFLDITGGETETL